MVLARPDELMNGRHDHTTAVGGLSYLIDPGIWIHLLHGKSCCMENPTICKILVLEESYNETILIFEVSYYNSILALAGSC